MAALCHSVLISNAMIVEALGLDATDPKAAPGSVDLQGRHQQGSRHPCKRAAKSKLQCEAKYLDMWKNSSESISTRLVIETAYRMGT